MMHAEAPRRGSVFAVVALGVVYWLLAVALQWGAGAFEDDFGGHPDEAAHVVTGLMVRDYVVAMPGPPMPYAEAYYAHYPKVAFGHWPPVFYVAQASWTLVFPPGRVSLLLLMAVFTAGLGLAVRHATRSVVGEVGALIAGGVSVGLPLVRLMSTEVMTEIPVALGTLVATLAFAAFVDRGRAASALAFGMVSTATILTHGSGWMLGFVPPVAIVLTRRFDLLRRPALWIAAGIVAIPCIPWYALTTHLASGTWHSPEPSLGYFAKAIAFGGEALHRGAGTVLAALAGLGLVVAAVRTARRKTETAIAPALLGLVAGWIVLYCVMPIGYEVRYAIALLPPLLYFASVGVASCAQGRSRLAMFVVATTIASLALEAGRVSINGNRGFGEAATRVLSEVVWSDSTLMVSSDAAGEGALIAAVALGETRPGHVVLRATKLLTDSDWSGEDYRVLHANVAETMACLERVPVGIVVIDRAIPDWNRFAHHALLERTIDAHPDRWQLRARIDRQLRDHVHSGAIEVWELRGHQALPRNPVDTQPGPGSSRPGR